MTGRTDEKVQALTAEIRDASGSAKAMQVDITLEAEPDALFPHASQKGPIAAVIFNAGNNAVMPFEKLAPKTVEKFWRLGCFSALLAAKRAIPILETQGKGSLFFTGASGSMRGRPNFAPFASMKAVLRMLA